MILQFFLKKKVKNKQTKKTLETERSSLLVSIRAKWCTLPVGIKMPLVIIKNDYFLIKKNKVEIEQTSQHPQIIL